MIKVTDIYTDQTRVMHVRDFAEIVTTWFEDPTPEILEAIADTHTKLNQVEVIGQPGERVALPTGRLEQGAALSSLGLEITAAEPEA